ncbi:cisplatin damage response ATP-dependent DNA ligase [Camelimonas abortus]|uniref:DNA ligase (ATP) n=1 Tax=Camelimonas abortus TaxID=1017184 RepID=A0ABV7LEQ0_9HYPH
MNRFAALADRLAFESSRNARLRILADYFATTPDPDRGYALAALAGELAFPHAGPALLRRLVSARVDPALFAMSYDYVGDLSETVALLWPAPRTPPAAGLSLARVVETMAGATRAQMEPLLAGWLDVLDETGRWALLKLVTGNFRVGVSGRLARLALARYGGREAQEIETIWPGLAPPYEALFAWAEGRGPRPRGAEATPFRPPMLSHPVTRAELEALDPADFAAEWKWDGIRVQAVAGADAQGAPAARLWSRAGEDISAAFPDLIAALLELEGFQGTLDGELLVARDGAAQDFNTLQQRLNRKTVSARMLRDWPAHIRVWDLLSLDGADLTPLPWTQRRERLEALVARFAHPRVSLSPLIPFASWAALAAARDDPAAAGAGPDAAAVEGCMLKRRDSVYVSGRPRGPWFKWKRDPWLVDAVLMYARRGHGRRSSFHSDLTFGVWTGGEDGEPRLTPVGKAYFGFTDAELAQLDRFIRNNTVARYGPVREVAHEPDRGLVLEIAFEGLRRSPRHRSGLAMRFPRIHRIRWDKPPAAADALCALERLLAAPP